MLSIGHVIMGDKLYAQGVARDAVERLHLHATRLSIKQPETQESMEFVSDAPF